MIKKRVHELAKELNIESKEVIKKLNQIGIEVKSHMSTIEDKEIEAIKQLYRKSSQPAEQKSTEMARTADDVNKDESSKEDKELNSSDTKKAARRRGSQNVRQRNDYSKGPGLVDRVPSRPPDRRFMEKTPEKQGRPWTPPKSDQPTRPAVVDPLPERKKIEQPQQERPSQQKSQAGSIRQERRPQTSDRPTLTNQKPAVDARDARQSAPGKPQEARTTGKRPAGEQASRTAATKEKRSVDHSQGQGAKQKQEQLGTRTAARTEDKGKLPPVPLKNIDKPKTAAKSGAPKPAKGRSEKRDAIAELAEGKLRSRKGSSKKRPAKKHQVKPLQPIEKKPVVLGESTTIQELSLKMHKSPAELIKKLFSMGVMATINQEIDTDTAMILAEEYGYEVEIKLPVDLEAQLMEEPEEDSALLTSRPSVVTVMGHVDHGKTSLLDAIRETNVTATEAGGITQAIGAYQVEHNGKKITFVDTPGHEAFTAMRARGAQVTDIAILVVAADDGVMPQTIEAINHAKDAKVPIIVAINKVDKPSANPDRVKQELTEHGLVAEEWGGDTICVNVSALKREGIADLLEMVLLVAEVLELKANPDRPARGTVIEAELDKARGSVASVLVQNGSLNVGDTIIAGAAFGRVRAMIDDKGRRIKKAGPSTPVEVIGFSEVPQAGDIFLAVEDEKLARTIVSRRQTRRREEELRSTTRVSLDDLFKHIQEGQIKELNIIVKADVQGSVEALRQSLERLNTGEVKVNIIHGGVGAITETDVMFASASNAIIIGFNVRPDVNARKAAESEKVDVRLYRVIYNAIEDVKAAMSGLLEPEYKEVTTGRAEVRQTFKASKIGTIAGCYVLEGKIERGSGVRLVRDGIVVHEGKIDSLKRFKDDVKEVVQGYECGITLEKYNEIKEGDIIEAFAVEAIKRELT
ncbi:MAG: translation initiation factor IF-2 [Pelotomaculum sp.]